MYTATTQMTPMFPTDRDGSLAELASTLIREAGTLGSVLRPATRLTIVELLRQMNSYYSNLIEGHYTHPYDIERAMRGEYSTAPEKRAAQLESRAHIEVQNLVEARLERESDLNICSPPFLCWIHEEFYNRVPMEFRVVRDDHGNAQQFEAGEIRKRHVRVGRHVPPAPANLPEFLNVFAKNYDPAQLKGLDLVVAAAASHHRLAWIHPFLDGNGRVTRLFTHAYFIRAKLDSHGLWTVSRGLSRNRDAYMAELMHADESRAGDLDGRGNLTDEGLRSFCRFFLNTAIDQVRFMGSLLDLSGLERRISAYVERRASLKELPLESEFVLREALLRGEVPRGDLPRVTGRPERSARRVLDRLLREGLVVSDTPKGPIRLGLPTSAVGYYFPRLYPVQEFEGVRAT